MVQHQVCNVPQVAHKVAELTNTLVLRDVWKGYCAAMKAEYKKGKGACSDNVDYEDGAGNDVSIFFGYDGSFWYVGLEEA